MRAMTVMAIAVLLFIIHRWATNKPAVTLPIVLSGLFAIGVIALLDHGRTEEIAKGFAWLFFAGAAYNAIPDLANASNKYAQSKAAQGQQLYLGNQPVPPTPLITTPGPDTGYHWGPAEPTH